MQGKAVAASLSKYVTSLVLTILAPLQWMRILKVAGKHHALDPNGRKKVGVGIAVGIVLAIVSTMMVVGFQGTATAGMYDSLDARLSTSTGNDAYEAHLKARDAARGLIDNADEKIAEAQAAGDAEAEQTWRDNRANFVATYNEAVANAAARRANADLYEDVSAVIQAHDEEAAKQLIADAAPMAGLSVGGSDNAFAIHADAVSDMKATLNWFVYPGLIGMLWAPIAFAIGHVLKTTFIPSDSVGYKPYPGTAAALFLLLGAFGVPAIFFAAWVMQDFADRTEVGQISL